MAQLKLSLLAGLDDLHRCTNSLVTADAHIEAGLFRAGNRSFSVVLVMLQ